MSYPYLTTKKTFWFIFSSHSCLAGCLAGFCDNFEIVTAREMTKYGVFSGPYFPVFGINTEIYEVNLCIQSKYGKIRTRRKPVFEHFLRSMFIFFRCNGYSFAICKNEKKKWGLGTGNGEWKRRTGMKILFWLEKSFYSLKVVF